MTDYIFIWLIINETLTSSLVLFHTERNSNKVSVTGNSIDSSVYRETYELFKQINSGARDPGEAIDNITAGFPSNISKIDQDFPSKLDNIVPPPDFPSSLGLVGTDFPSSLGSINPDFPSNFGKLNLDLPPNMGFTSSISNGSGLLSQGFKSQPSDGFPNSSSFVSVFN